MSTAYTQFLQDRLQGRIYHRRRMEHEARTTKGASKARIYQAIIQDSQNVIDGITAELKKR